MIFILKRKDRIGWDEYEEMVVRADNEDEARRLANEDAGDEGQLWTDYEIVSCKVVSTLGEKEVILAAFDAG